MFFLSTIHKLAQHHQAMYWLILFGVVIGGLFVYAKAMEAGLFQRREIEEIDAEQEASELNDAEVANTSSLADDSYTGRSLLSPVEQKFFYALRTCLSPQATILSKIRLADLIRAKDQRDFSKSQSLFNKISRKHIDFAICRASDLSILGLIELDDTSHFRRTRKARDTFVNTALAQAGIKIIHIRTQRWYASTQLKLRLQTELGIGIELLN